LIEERTGIDLGEVPVISMREGIRESRRDLLEEFLREGKLDKGFGYHFFNVFSFSLIELQRMWSEEFSFAAYDSGSKKFLTPFGLRTKSMLRKGSFYEEDQHTDEIILHELTHHLWNQIPNRREFGKTPEIWVEGFAAYGHLNWFSDFLPAGEHKYSGEYAKIHKLGAKLIKGVVKIHGEEVLLEIPRRWPEFDKELELGNV